jgi:hypothetical protein
MGKILRFLNRLDKEKIPYTIGHFSADSLTVTVVVPGQRWEVQFMGDGEIGIEKFRSNGDIQEGSELESLFE